MYNQNILCLPLFLLIGIFGLVKLLSWIGDHAVLGKQISYMAGLFCFGNVVPTIIIRRSLKMTEYFIKSTKEKFYDIMTCLQSSDDDEFQSRYFTVVIR